ncbi:MAG: hypothetical protein HQL52_15315 [Magnetococcales bacterium]|nr:hypothetical protein [Magnetococcales bacterium]
MKISHTSGVALFLAAFFLAAQAPQAAEPANPVRGQELHDPSCLTECHARRAGGEANRLYTRKNRKQDSLAKLKAQVSFCNQQVLGSEWWPEDEADVVGYLNKAFYHFK